MRFKNMGLLRLSLLATTLLPSALAQTIATGEVTGIVLDPSGAAVPDAAVVLESTDTGDSRQVPTSGAGEYRFPFVKPGRYQLSGSALGLKSDVMALVVNVGQAQSRTVVLTVQPAKQVVEVSDATPLLGTDNANIVYTLSRQQLSLLPLPGSDLVSTVYAVPGAVPNTRGVRNGSVVVQGVGATSNLFTVNGVDDMLTDQNVNNSGVTGLLLGLNEVQEVSVIQNAYEGQYGRQAGAQVNFVTRTGTNAYHGDLTYSYNGTPLNANNFFSNTMGTPRPKMVSNQYAGSIGGPVLRNKLFFFADGEGLRYALPKSGVIAAIPTSALETYTLKSIQPSQVPFYQKMFDLYNSAPGHERAVPVINGNGLLQDRNGNLGCGSLAGTPTGSGGVFGVDTPCEQAWSSNIPAQTSEWLLAARADYNLDDKQRMYFRFKTDHGNLLNSVNAINPLFNVVSSQPDYEGHLGHTIAISPRFVNNFVGAVTYNNYVFGFANPAETYSVLPVRVNLLDWGPNGFNSARGWLGPPPAYPQGGRSAQLQLVDDISYQMGRHSLRAGINYRFNRRSDLQTNAHGVFNVFSLRAFAQGAIDGAGNYQQAFMAHPVTHTRLYNFGAYIQDQWSVNPHLKVMAAVRFDRTGNPYCADLCYSRLLDPFPELAHGLGIPYNTSIQTGLAHAYYAVEPIIPQPRVSFSYNPARSQATVIRGGIGMFADLFPGGNAAYMTANAPYAFPSNIGRGLINAGGAGSAPDIAAASARAFQTQFAGGATLAQLQQAVAPASFSPPNYFSVPAKQRSAKFLEWNLEVQRQVGTRNVLTVRYTGNHGRDILTTNSLVNASGFIGLPATTPDSRFAYVTQYSNNGYSNYNALAVVLQRAMGRGFQGQISYTWSHALDTLSNGGTTFDGFSVGSQIDPRSLRSLNYSNADYDVRHNITADLVWDSRAKLGNRLANIVLSGWSIGTRMNAHTGTPFSVTNGPVTRSLQSTVLADAIDPTVERRCGISAVKAPCFTASQFAPAGTQLDFGNIPRNSFRGPGFFNFDTSLYRNLQLGERTLFSLGATAYNLLNHTNFTNPNFQLGSSGLGLITDTTRSPSSPYGQQNGFSARVVVINGRLRF